MTAKKKKLRPEQSQRLPGKESELKPQPVYDRPDMEGSGKLKNKIALITGGDSGIGKSIAIQFAKEGADIAIVYLSEDKDAKETASLVKSYGRKILLIKGDISKEKTCKSVIEKTIKKYGVLNILVNNAAVQFEEEDFENIQTKNLVKTFQVNIFSYFWMTRYAMKYLKKGSVILNTASVTAYRGSHHLIDYAATKGAVVSFTRSLAANLASKGIRVNAVAPGPIWTPLIPASFDKKDVAVFGSDAPMKRAGEPVEAAACFVFLASPESSYMTGQVLHPNGGEVING